MNVKHLIPLGTVAFALSLGHANAAACVSHPTYAFNGLIRIDYPSANSRTADVTRICNNQAITYENEIMAQAQRSNVGVKWVETYEVQNWAATFHDTIYKSRALGYGQSDYKQYSNFKWKDSSTLIYANRSGKFLGMIQVDRGRANNSSATFVLFGN